MVGTIVNITNGDVEAETVNVTNRGLDVNIQDQVTENISLYLGQHLAEDLTFEDDTILNQEEVQVSSPTEVPVAGNFICAKEGANFSQMEILTVVDDTGDLYTLTLAMPLDFPFTTAALVCYLMLKKMLILLDNGVYFRLEDGTAKNLFNVKENADLANEGYDLMYSDRTVPSGAHGTRARITWSGQDKSGVALRLSEDNDDKFVSIVRDKIDAAEGISRMRVKVQGHVVE